MTTDPHERARRLIALSGTDTWLAGHLASCAPCREFAESVADTIRALHAVPVAADRGLVSATQMRVRQRAGELQRRRERQWTVGVCCAAVTLCTAVTSVALWFGFAWMGQQARLSPPVWGTCYAAFCLMPVILAGGLLLARGTHLADDRHQGGL